MIGEWCVDTSSNKVEGLNNDEKIDCYRRIYDAMSNAWKRATAWTYWTDKHRVDKAWLDTWDFGKSIDLGYLPESF